MSWNRLQILNSVVWLSFPWALVSESQGAILLIVHMCTRPIQSPWINDFMAQLALSETIFTKAFSYFMKPWLVRLKITHLQILNCKRTVNENGNSDQCKANSKLFWIYKDEQKTLELTMRPDVSISFFFSLKRICLDWYDSVEEIHVLFCLVFPPTLALNTTHWRCWLALGN